MWPWRWERFNFIASACVALLCGSAMLSAIAADSPDWSTRGPTSPAELQILWQKSRAAFGSGDFKAASFALRRIVDRYPGSPDYLEATRMLGHAELEQGHYAEAKEQLKNFIEAQPNRPTLNPERIALSRAYLGLNRPSEALLVADEAIKAGTTAPALVAKTRALIALKQETRATSAMLEASKLEPKSAEVAELRLKLKTLECQKFPTAASLTEDQILDQNERQSLCLIEAVPLLRRVFELAPEKSAIRETAWSDYKTTQVTYQRFCNTPPKTIGKRTIQESQRQLQEMTQKLQAQCTAKTITIQEALKDLK